MIASRSIMAPDPTPAAIPAVMSATWTWSWARVANWIWLDEANLHTGAHSRHQVFVFAKLEYLEQLKRGKMSMLNVLQRRYSQGGASPRRSWPIRAHCSCLMTSIISWYHCILQARVRIMYTFAILPIVCKFLTLCAWRFGSITGSLVRWSLTYHFQASNKQA